MKRWLPIVLILSLMATGFYYGLHNHLSLSSLISQREALANFVSDNWFVAIGTYMLIYIAVVAISFPGGAALTIASGLIFGWFVGGSATVVAATIGAVIIFSIAKSSFGEIFKGRAGPLLDKMVEGFKEDAFQYLLTLRLVPVFPFWAVNIVPGILGVKLSQYTTATFFGIIPGTFAFAYLGGGLDSVIAEQEKANQGCAALGECEIDVGSLVTVELLVALFLLAALSLLPVLINRFKKQPIEKAR